MPGCAANWSETILLTSASDNPVGIWIPAIADCKSAAVMPPASITAVSTAFCRSATEMPGCASSWSETILLTSAAEIPGWAAPSTILVTSASDRPSGIWMLAIAACKSAAVMPAGAGAGAGSGSSPHAAANANSIAADTATTNQRSEVDIRMSLSPSGHPQETPLCRNGPQWYGTDPMTGYGACITDTSRSQA